EGTSSIGNIVTAATRLRDGTVFSFVDSSSWNNISENVIVGYAGTATLNWDSSGTLSALGGAKFDVGRDATPCFLNQSDGLIEVGTHLQVLGGSMTLDGVIDNIDSTSYIDLLTTGTTGTISIVNGGADYTSALQGFIDGGKIRINGAVQSGYGNFNIVFDGSKTTISAGDASAMPPTISSFTANPTEVVPGGSTTLSWSTVNADSLSIDQGIGDVTGMTSIPVVVTDHTTYTLIAVNAEGSSTSSVSVVLRLAITNLVIGSGTVEVEWNRASGHYIVVSGDDLLSFPAAGAVEASETVSSNSAATFPYAADRGFFQIMLDIATVGTITSPELHAELKVQSPVIAPTNEVYDVDFEGVVGLTLPGQDVTVAELAEFGNLDKLSLAGSALTTLGDLSSLNGITWLNLSSNQLASTSGLGVLTSLETLDLQNNLIADLSGIESLIHLRWLDLENNQITDLSAVLSNAANGGLGERDELWVRGNPLSTTATNQIQTLETTYKVKVFY
ncbi:MAG: leucine-rich repeat domain-containing protein, partial [Verrucomicrobia bacterium]|nr:leucine-rich repeat domain-containing protein [Verrucomicrobiota bacterium]